MAGCDGARRWIDRVYRLFIESGKVTDTNDGKLDKVYNQTVKKVTEDYESLGGLIIEHLDRLPNKGDSVVIDNCKLTVIKMDEKRIDLVKVVVTPKEDETTEYDTENEE